MKPIILMLSLFLGHMNITYAQENPVYAIALVKIKNSEKMGEYLKYASPLIAEYQGEIVSKGKVVSVFNGNADYDMVAIAEFPTSEAIDGFYNSSEYQAIIPLRDAAADVTFFTFSVPKK
jgi:uncharacterized protein (DUF1330 family)